MAKIIRTKSRAEGGLALVAAIQNSNQRSD